MIGEWIRFILTAVLLFASLTAFTAAVIGAYRFGFVMNRLHAAGIGDTLGTFGMIAALLIGGGLHMSTLKLALIILFLWFTSPASSHFLAQIEYYTNPHLFRYTDRRIHRVRKADSFPKASADGKDAGSGEESEEK